MQFFGLTEKTQWIRDLRTYRRELLFWLLLLPACGALGSRESNRQIAGLVETCAFLVVAMSSMGRLKSLGLAFAAWNPLCQQGASICTLVGLLAGAIIASVARLTGQPLGVESGWNKVVLAVSLGPVLEEVIFRGYLFTAALFFTGRMSGARSTSISIVGIAVLFSIAHLATPGITVLQFCCIGLTGSLYGYIRFRTRSTAAAALTHGMYNFTLYLAYWFGLAR